MELLSKFCFNFHDHLRKTFNIPSLCGHPAWYAVVHARRLGGACTALCNVDAAKSCRREDKNKSSVFETILLVPLQPFTNNYASLCGHPAWYTVVHARRLAILMVKGGILTRRCQECFQLLLWNLARHLPMRPRLQVSRTQLAIILGLIAALTSYPSQPDPRQTTGMVNHPRRESLPCHIS